MEREEIRVLRGVVYMMKSRTPTSDRRTDGRTDGHTMTAYTALA